MPRLAFKYLLGLAVLAGLALSVFGCASSGVSTPPALPGSMQVDPPSGSKLLNANIHAGDALSSILLNKASGGSGILVASLVDMDTLETSSSFGRTSSQQIASRISQNGYKVIDVRLTNDMLLDIKQGEFMLSRRTANLLKRDYDAHAVMVGIYSRSAGKVFVSVRVVRLSDSVVLAAYEYYLPYDADVAYLLNRASGGGAQAGAGGYDSTWQKYAARPRVCSGQTNDAQAKPGPTPRQAAPQSAGKDAPYPQKDDPAPQYESRHVPQS